jgi:hypothetical protein
MTSHVRGDREQLAAAVRVDRVKLTRTHLSVNKTQPVGIYVDLREVATIR